MADAKGNPVIGALKKIAPYLGAAASTMLPGPLGAVAGALTRTIASTAPEGVQTTQVVQPTVESISNAVTSILGDPAALAHLREEEHQYMLAMQKAGFDHVDKIAELGNDDRKDARAMRVATRDWTPTIGFFVLLGMFVTAFIYLVTHPVPEANKGMVYGMVGTIGTLTVTSATFFYGTTRDSGRKTELLAKAQPVQDEVS